MTTDTDRVHDICYAAAVGPNAEYLGTMDAWTGRNMESRVSKVTTIDDIMFPDESRRLEIARLDSNIRTLDAMIHALSILDSPSRHTTLKSPLDGRASQSESAGRDVTTGAGIGLPAPIFTEHVYRRRLSNGTALTIRCTWLGQGHWVAKDDDCDRHWGEGADAESAADNLMQILEERL